MRFVKIETVSSGVALVDLDKISHAVTHETGIRLHLGSETLDLPYTFDELENLLAGRDRSDNGETSMAGFGVARQK